MENKTFGKYLSELRASRQITLRKFSQEVGVSPVYICDIEKDRKAAPSDERLKQIIQILNLDKIETDNLYDLAAMSRTHPAVSNDLSAYIMEKDIVRYALRTAKDGDATDAEWQDFINKINERIANSERKEGD